ncbi:RNA polymerase subunit sigma [Streptomyces sp. NPDC050534]|uniref:RNA polymerase subunit sigma n=1 Tax=Streptomyces sp. NPDC050534 TaxID=3365625 RepID=UPI0037AA3CE1
MDEADAVPIADLVDERRYLLDVAYWMLGSAGEAERVVDEVYRRWYGLSDEARRQIARPRSWLAKTAGQGCLSRLAGTGQRDGGPEQECLPTTQQCLLTALDVLSPPERAAFVLGDLFGTAQEQVADIVERSGPEYAELAERARESVRTQRARQVAPREQDAVVRAVGRACREGDGELLASLLCARATAFVDGGGKVRAPDRPVHGGLQVARTLLTLLARRPRTTLSAQSVNGRTGLVVRYERRVAAVICLDVADHRVAHVWVILNPDKLRSWNLPSDPLPTGE